MAIIHHEHGEAEPREQAPTQTLGQPETHNENDTTANKLMTRRRILQVLGLGSVLVVGGAILPALDSNNPQDERAPEALPNATPEQQRPRGDFDVDPPVFKNELRRDQIHMPETLNPPTFEEAFANVGLAIQYGINADDPRIIRRVVPGTTDGYSMQPGPLEYRSAYIQRYRNIPQYHKEDPENDPVNYAWGFAVKLLEQTNNLGAEVMDANYVAGRVEVSYGDYRPSFDGTNSRVWTLERPERYETDMVLTRWTHIATGRTQPDNGWIVYQMGFPKVPEIMEKSPPPGFENGVPLLYYGPTVEKKITPAKLHMPML